MDLILNHIQNAKTWQIEQTLDFYKELLTHKNTIIKHSAKTMVTYCSLELHKRP